MTNEQSNWTYNEFLAYLMIYAAELNYTITDAELDLIKQKTGISDVSRIKAKVDEASDAEALEIIDSYRELYLDTPEKEEKVRHDLQDLLNTGGQHTQLESVLVHILERII